MVPFSEERAGLETELEPHPPELPHAFSLGGPHPVAAELHPEFAPGAHPVTTPCGEGTKTDPYVGLFVFSNETMPCVLKIAEEGLTLGVPHPPEPPQPPDIEPQLPLEPQPPLLPLLPQLPVPPQLPFNAPENIEE